MKIENDSYNLFKHLERSLNIIMKTVVLFNITTRFNIYFLLLVLSAFTGYATPLFYGGWFRK